MKKRKGEKGGKRNEQERNRIENGKLRQKRNEGMGNRKMETEFRLVGPL